MYIVSSINSFKNIQKRREFFFFFELSNYLVLNISGLSYAQITSVCNINIVEICLTRLLEKFN